MPAGETLRATRRRTPRPRRRSILPSTRLPTRPLKAETDLAGVFVTAIPPSALAAHGQEALLLTAALALPVLGIAAVVGLVVAAFQAASQIQDPTISHLPRLLAVVLALAGLGAWMGHEVAAFAERMF